MFGAVKMDDGRLLPPLLLRAKDVARAAGVSLGTVWRWSRTGQIPGVRRIGTRTVRFSRDEVEPWISARLRYGRVDLRRERGAS